MSDLKDYEMTTPTDTTIKVTKKFDAPKEMIWKIWTDPELIPQWWGPRKYKTVIDKYDLRVGGEWRFLQTDEEGNEFAFHGVFKEIDEPKKVVQTFVFEPMPDKELTDTLTIEEVDGKTTITTISQFANKEDRDGMIASGMESGQKEGFERTEELIKKLKSGV